jgi:hypothetical protein
MRIKVSSISFTPKLLMADPKNTGATSPLQVITRVQAAVHAIDQFHIFPQVAASRSPSFSSNRLALMLV